jgi:hypothetical protein
MKEGTAYEVIDGLPVGRDPAPSHAASVSLEQEFSGGQETNRVFS